MTIQRNWPAEVRQWAYDTDTSDEAGAADFAQALEELADYIKALEVVLSEAEGVANRPVSGDFAKWDARVNRLVAAIQSVRRLNAAE